MRKTILTIAAIVIAYISVFSQSVTETRQIKTTALQMYENYKVVVSGLYSRSAYTEDNFMALFESKAMIYNDILPDNNTQQLSPAEYFKKFQANIQRIYPAFSGFKMGEPVYVENKWQIKCHFTRITRIRTQKDMKYPEWSFNYTMTIEMDKSYNIINKVYENAKIVSVDVDNPLKNFFIIENKENIPFITKSGEMLNDWDEEYQSRIFPEDKWKISDISVPESAINDNIFELSKSKFSKNRKDANFYQLDILHLKKDIFGIGVNFSPFTSGNKMSDENAKIFGDIKYNISDAMSLSVFYGKQIFHKEKSTVFANIGLDINMYAHTYWGENYIERNTTDTDDGYMYSRNIKIDNLNEKINMTSVSVPLSVQYLHQLTEQSKNPIFFSCEFGVFAEATLSSKSEYSFDAKYSGKYGAEYFYVELEHYLDFGTFNSENGNKINGEQNLKTKINGGVFGGIGLWFALNEGNLLKFNFSYKHSFNSPLEYKENYLISYDKDNYESLLHSTKQGMRNIGIGISWVKIIGGNK